MPDLTLTARDQENLESAIRCLLVCTAHRSLIDWRLDVQRAMKRLVDGDMAMSYVGTRPFDSLISEEATRIGEFPGRASSLIGRFNTFERTESLEVWDRSTLWAGHMKEFLRSPFYNEFARPLRSLDGLGLTIRTGRLHAGVQIHGERKVQPRQVALLRLLLPVFEIAIHVATDHFRETNGEPNNSLALNGGQRSPSQATVPQIDRRFRASLTGREMEVVKLLAARRSNYEIAALLHVSRATAKRHTENILQKLGLHSRREVERVIDIL